ncbi:MAG: hypothetical protein H8D65_01035, partial [Spirochaetes bacterium]|nr:hypothetical protein [Spirochaetota bacterium]
ELSLRLDFTPVENDYTDEFETDCSVYVLTYPVVDGVQLTHSETYTGIDFPKEGTFTLQVTPDDIILMNEMNENDAVSNEKER